MQAIDQKPFLPSDERSFLETLSGVAPNFLGQYRWYLSEFPYDPSAIRQLKGELAGALYEVTVQEQLVQKNEGCLVGDELLRYLQGLYPWAHITNPMIGSSYFIDGYSPDFIIPSPQCDGGSAKVKWVGEVSVMRRPWISKVSNFAEARTLTPSVFGQSGLVLIVPSNADYQCVCDVRAFAESRGVYLQIVSGMDSTRFGKILNDIIP